MTRIRTILGILIPITIVALICGNAMRITGKDNDCTAAGGHLEFSTHWPGEECVRDGHTVDP